MSQVIVPIRKAHISEYEAIGEMMVRVYASLPGFPSPEQQPRYYEMLRNVGELTSKPGAELLVAMDDGVVVGAVVYFNDMSHYGSGGTASLEKDAAGFRLLAVDTQARGKGVGKRLTEECISKARTSGVSTLVIHTTRSMPAAWRMYESLGFTRRVDLDFKQGDLEVFGLCLRL